MKARATGARRQGSGHVPLPWLPGLFALALMAQAPQASAQQQPGRGRNFQQPIGQTVAEQTTAQYRFERFVVTSPDGARRWRINVGIPKTKAPVGGFPAFWMLDGNAALLEFDETLLNELAARDPHVLVFVGYDNEWRIDSAARTLDYTPSSTERGEDDVREVVGGGAAAFLALIEREIRPQVAARVALDPQRQALWGHSFGGLFVLHALYTQAGAFQTFAPASPSLWWDEGMMLGAPEQHFIAQTQRHHARVLLMLGGAERHPDHSGRDMDNPRVAAHMKRVTSTPSDAAFTLSQRLRTLPGLQVEYREFDGLGHGPMLRASLLHALHAVTGIADHSGEPRP